jgi:hypothetical protein
LLRLDILKPASLGLRILLQNLISRRTVMRLVLRCHIGPRSRLVDFWRIAFVVIVGRDDSTGGVNLDLVHGVNSLPISGLRAKRLKWMTAQVRSYKWVVDVQSIRLPFSRRLELFAVNVSAKLQKSLTVKFVLYTGRRVAKLRYERGSATLYIPTLFTVRLPMAHPPCAVVKKRLSWPPSRA